MQLLNKVTKLICGNLCHETTQRYRFYQPIIALNHHHAATHLSLEANEEFQGFMHGINNLILCSSWNSYALKC